MKSARERAREMLALVDIPLTLRGEVLRKAEQAFQEHARDQRQLCAEAINDADYSRGAPVDTAHSAAMNALLPGEEQ